MVAGPLKILYLTYDGVLEPLGRSQVVEYLVELAADHNIILLSFEKPGDLRDTAKRRDLALRLAAAGITWRALTYHKRPAALATAFDIACGTMVGAWLAVRHDVRIVHARSYVMGLIATMVSAMSGARFLFDMRGFWPDEKLEMGHWSRQGVMYRIFKKLEVLLFRRADGVVSLTEAGVHRLRALGLLGSQTPVTVIPTCTNVTRFGVPAARDSAFTVAYFGSLTRWYRFDLVLEAFAAISAERADARLLIVTRDDTSALPALFAQASIAPAAVEVRSASYEEIPLLMAQSAVGVFFITPSHAKLASSPTKLAEFMAAGVPCLSNTGVGDYGDFIQDNRLGVCVEELTPAAVRAGARQLLKLLDEDAELSGRCRQAAFQALSHQQGARLYAQMYRTLIA